MKQRLFSLLIVLFCTALMGQDNNFSLHFDGDNDYANLGGSSLLNPSAFSIIAHVRMTNAPSVYNTIISRWESTGHSYILFARTTDQKLRLGTFSGGIEQTLIGSATVTDTTWHHIAATFDGNTGRLYVDGVLDGEKVLGPLDLANEITYLGRNNEGPVGRTLDGNIAYVGLFDYAIDSLMVADFVACPPIGTESGLVGFWNLEEGSGSTIVDSSPFLTSGSLHNGTTWSTDVPVLNCCNANLLLIQPVDQAVAIDSAAIFSVVDSLSAASYQWQMDMGTGYVNLSNAGQFSGTDSSVLTVSSVSLANDNSLFRCIISSSPNCSDTTRSARLNVSKAMNVRNSQSIGVSIFPNPAQSTLFIKTQELGIFSFQLTNIAGQIVHQGTIQEGQISLSDLPVGIYFLTLMNSKQSMIFRRKIFKQ